MFKNENMLFASSILFTACILVFAPTSSAVGMDSPPEAGCNFEISPGPYYVNESITFTDISNPPSGNVKEHIWDFRDESEWDYSTNPTHIFTEEGYYKIHLVIVMDDGKIYTYSKRIEVITPEIPPMQMAEASSSENATDSTSVINSKDYSLENIVTKFSTPIAEPNIAPLVGSYAQAKI